MKQPRIDTAFDQGRSASNRDLPRSANPYMPCGQQELYEAWNCGFDEEEPRYVVAKR